MSSSSCDGVYMYTPMVSSLCGSMVYVLGIMDLTRDFNNVSTNGFKWSFPVGQIFTLSLQ